ncbi:nicotinamidase-like amidase [Desulfocapsa sulfexigens DSM 10523]|uniref:Nicotinamidase-like amidase n=1 Tax=Desulfocapsa sulfexigens (strain DSM 10523 / SB164P1) TaxID=1167006 RepID=M1P447_DESSD|nr:isochorismatase family protein [Desulfocapsa sulfexigens]AGF78258.1 nicotinamidase-like amidase [Desulfocapsa sulfexigens DSM 10523]
MLQSESCYLHIIDPQERLMAHIHEASRVTETIIKMVNCARIIGLPVIANTQYKKGLGAYVTGLEELMDEVPRPDKIEFNALANAETKELVSALPATVDTAILVGVETHICVYQTALGLQELGFSSWIVADGVSSRLEKNHLLGLARLRDTGAAIGPAEMILYELLAKAGSAQFKEVLPHII